MKEDTKKIFLKTWGCQMNEYDTELIRSILRESGYVFADSELEADVILLNTCSVREKANRTVFGLVHKIRHDRQGRPAIYGILGCMATDLKEELLNDTHLDIDLIAGPDSYRQLPELIRMADESKSCDVTLSETETYADVTPDRESAANAWIAIMRGCNNFCSYCVVPFTRGRERSRDPATILKEAEALAADGFPQVTLLGQNVNSYHFNGVTFPDLLEQICAIDGLRRVWWTSPHPRDVADRLIDVIAENPRICRHIHLPLQSGSDEILTQMNRPYTQAHYLNLVDKIRSRCPAIAITTDIIVGFPGETDAQFQETVKVFETVGYDAAFIFKYSPRKQTKAARDYDDDVSDEAKTRRIVALNELQQTWALRRNEALLGTTQEIMIETVRKDVMEGRTIQNKRVILDRTSEPQSPSTPYIQNSPESRGAGEPGDFRSVEITQATPHLLKGRPV